MADSSEQHGPCELIDESPLDRHRRSKRLINPIPEIHCIPGTGKGDRHSKNVVAPSSKDHSRMNKDFTK